MRLFVLSRHYHAYVSSETISVSISLTHTGAPYRRHSGVSRWISSGSMQLGYCIKCTRTHQPCEIIWDTQGRQVKPFEIYQFCCREWSHACVSKPFIQGEDLNYKNVSRERWGGPVKIRNERGPHWLDLTLQRRTDQNETKELLVAHGNYSSNSLRRTNIPAIFSGIISRYFKICIHLLHYFPPKPGWETQRYARTFWLFVFFL
jgi:hypothetical protein